jgi:hypothetical protein
MEKVFSVIAQKPIAEGGAFLAVGDDEAILSSGGRGFATSEKYGNIVSGPLSIFSDFDKIKIMGIFSLNPALMTCVPSTAATPIPVLQPASINSMTEAMRNIIAEAIDVILS